MSWVTSLRQTGSGGRGRLELELLWASTSETRTELASVLLLDLDTLAGLLPLHTMCQTWSYAWMSCPHQFVQMNPRLSRHHHYQLVLLLDGWYRLDWSLGLTDLECCDKPAHLDQLEIHGSPLSWHCGICP